MSIILAGYRKARSFFVRMPVFSQKKRFVSVNFKLQGVETYFGVCICAFLNVLLTATRIYYKNEGCKFKQTHGEKFSYSRVPG